MDPKSTPIEEPSSALSRRLVLGGSSAVVGAALVTAACSRREREEAVPGGPETSPATESGDLEVAELAAGLEVLAVNTYKSTLDAATAGKLGTVPPAVAEYVQTAMAHHEEARDAWNAVLKDASKAEVTEPNAQLQPTVDADFAKVTDVVGAANLALKLESIAADTYLKAVPTIQSSDARKLAVSIQAVDQQHQAILLFALGMYPVPEVFQATTDAITG